MMNEFDIDIDIDTLRRSPTSSAACLLSVDEQFRYSWNLGSFCSIYSRSKHKWFIGQIIDIYIDQKTNKEWFTVKYDGNKKKHIQRLCEDIKPITPTTTDFSRNNKNESGSNDNSLNKFDLNGILSAFKKFAKSIKSQKSNSSQSMSYQYIYLYLYI